MEGDMNEPDELQSFGMEQPELAPPPAPPPGKIAIIGAGDSVRVKLLAGVNAPTDGSPYPVVFKLIGDVFGPDGSALPLGEARLVAAAQGSLADQRALFRATTLNIRFPDGRRKVIDVDGWIVGEDGIRGMQGLLIDPIGKGIAAAGAAGFLSGVGQGFSAAQLDSTQNDSGNWSQTVSGNTTAFALGRGVSGMANEWSSVIRDRVDQLVPHVQVLSGREATAVFARSVTIPGLFDALEGEDNPYSSLD
jgi:conjugal transfer pilus assembly protein TraB